MLLLCLARPDLLEERPGWGVEHGDDPARPLSRERDGSLLAELRRRGRALGRDVARPNRRGRRGKRTLRRAAARLRHRRRRPGGVRRGRPALDRGADRQPPGPSRARGAGCPRTIGRDREGLRPERGPPPVAARGVGRRSTAASPRSSRKGLIQAQRSRDSQEDELPLPPRPHPGRGICRDHEGATGRPPRAVRLLARAEERGRRARRLSRGAGAPLPRRVAASDPELARLAAWAGERLAAAGIRAWKRADTPATINLLEASRRPLITGRPERAEVLCELGIAQRWSGDFDGAEKTLNEAIDIRRRDRRVELRARLEQAHARLFSESVTELRRCSNIAAEAIPIFEELGDDRSAWARLAARRIRSRRNPGPSRRLAGSRRARARPLSPLWMVSVRLLSGAGSCPAPRADAGR